ncbi:PPOX class probable F420-dependent enzyme [Actinocorallia herbida]|uniref:PPOX class probable F420-dependent enzyme n=1 Tax=Actinocorallia herbida TaxID=58109 RepID=A0A3N1CSU5_9ACTN|nr:TIGR03618 family F420-dependent PPOX class oxidoreductase [Actinocorallia herbida]ROO84381.1 PPOX class probable F420-dependent enzyme [Actinocorallia herbida]
MTTRTYGPGQGPAARPLTDTEADRILRAQSFGVLATVKRNGDPHLATLAYVWDPESRLLRFSSAEGRIKVTHLRRDPRATLHVQGDTVLSYALVEGLAEVSPPSLIPGDATGLELLAMSGGFPDPADETAFLARMAEDHRVVIRLKPTRLHGTALDA